MSKKKERVEVLNKAGINTGKYFSFKLDEGLKPGASITLVIGDNGLPVMVNRTESTAVDLVREEIFANGYVKNTKLHRRWVMAHMFRMLNYVSNDGYDKGYDAALNHWHGFDYQFKVLGDELKTLAKLEQSDYECFLERESFFNKDIVVATCLDYMDKLRIYIDKLKVKHCKGVPYKTIHGNNIFVSDLHRKIYSPLSFQIVSMKSVKTYKDLKAIFDRFMKGYIKLPWDTKKCKVWKDAYKGAGAFYTLKNMIMYHKCYVANPESKYIISFMNREDSLKWIQNKRIEYKGEYWRMFALMKKVIEDNNFDFDKRMKELYD